MGNFLIAALLILCASAGRAGELILPYQAFGPQCAAYKLIGMAWWQWDSNGGDTDRDFSIKIVVLWDQTLEETTKRHPVDQVKQLDFRYVEYQKAIHYLETFIKDTELDTKSMQQTLAELKEQRKGKSPQK